MVNKQKNLESIEADGTGLEAGLKKPSRLRRVLTYLGENYQAALSNIDYSGRMFPPYF
jgi:hypothetical protein